MIVFRRFPIRYIRSFTEKKQEQDMKKQQEMFKTMIDDLSRKETYTLRDFKKEIANQEKQGKSFLRKIFSEADKDEIELERTKKILCAFKEEELGNNKQVNGEVKSEISQVTQTTIQNVNDVLKSFEMQVKLHQYLKSRREKGEYIPQTREELENMMRTDRPPANKHDMYNLKDKFSTKQRKWLPGSK